MEALTFANNSSDPDADSEEQLGSSSVLDNTTWPEHCRQLLALFQEDSTNDDDALCAENGVHSPREMSFSLYI